MENEVFNVNSANELTENPDQNILDKIRALSFDEFHSFWTRVSAEAESGNISAEIERIKYIACNRQRSFGNPKLAPAQIGELERRGFTITNWEVKHPVAGDNFGHTISWEI